MKRIGASFIDYEGQRYAIRVWNDSCHPMRRDEQKWISFDNLYTLPVPPPALQSGALKEVLQDYESCEPTKPEEDIGELRRLLTGEVSFEIAVGSSRRTREASI